MNVQKDWFMNVEDAKAIMRAQDDWEWNKFTANAAKDILVGLIGRKYDAVHGDKKCAEIAVRYAMALTEELRNKLGEQ